MNEKKSAQRQKKRNSLKVFLCTALLLITFCSFGQTREETETWITYYFNRFFKSEDLRDMYTENHFSFKEGKIIINSDTYEKIKGRPDSLTKSETSYMDISKLKKVYLCAQADSSRWDKNFWGTLCFDFTPNDAFNDINLINVDNITHQKKSSYYTRYLLYTYDAEIMRDNMPQRIDKAFQHLVTLYGGHPVKDVF